MSTIRNLNHTPVLFPKSQIERLAKFLMKHYPNEMGRVGSESAVDMAIRLLTPDTITPKEK